MCAPFFSPFQELPYFINPQHNSQVSQAIVQCVPVPTHLAYETLGEEQTNLFLVVRNASLTIFSSLCCAKHF
jgi:hypothetical protein